MHWLSYKVQHQLLLNRRHVFPGFLLAADKSMKLSCFHRRTNISKTWAEGTRAISLPTSQNFWVFWEYAAERQYKN